MSERTKLPNGSSIAPADREQMLLDDLQNRVARLDNTVERQSKLIERQNELLERQNDLLETMLCEMNR
jgi:uncharacterized protein YoxC